MNEETVKEVAAVASLLLPPEIRVFASLAVKLGMKGYDVVKLMKEHGVTDEQIKEADLENEIGVYERIEQLKTEHGG